MIHVRRLSRRVLIVFHSLIVFLASVSSLSAQVYLPAPGGAPGADTGDAPIAFAGLAEIPSADLFTGTANTRIAIEVPPGRQGASPALALQYSSNSGPSPYGYGWTLPIPRVARSTKHGVPRFDGSDVFLLSLGATRVELEPEPGTPRYRAKIEGAYLRIGFDAAANRWRVIDKSGTTFEFGLTPRSRLGPAPDRDDGTSVWLLDRSVDTFGNHVDYEYLADVANAGLPSRIRYGGNVEADPAHPFEVLFRWGPSPFPSEPVVSYRAGYSAPHSHLLVAVETRTPTGLARRYSLSHTVDEGTGHAQLVGVSLDGFAPQPSDDVALPSTVFVYSPPAAHDWPLGTESQRREHALVLNAPGPLHDSGVRIEFDTFDIDGDAIVDYVSTKTSPPTIRRGGPDGFGPEEAWPWPANARRIRKVDSGNDITTNVFDLTGDGLPDLVDARESECGSGMWCVYRNTGNGFDLTPIRWPAHGNRIRGADIDGKTVRSDVADLDGDGRPDLIDATVYAPSNPYWNVYRNEGLGFALKPIRFGARSPSISRSETDGDRSFLLYGLHDMNGDGLPDFVRADIADLGAPLPLSQPHWEVHLNTGKEFLERPLQWRIEGPLGMRVSNFMSSRLVDPDGDRSETYDELLDINGDGRPDWVRHYNGADYLAFGLDPLPCASGACSPSGSAIPPQCCFHILVFLNTGSSFSEPTPWAAWHDYLLRRYSRSPGFTAREFDLMDYDGDGLIDLVEMEGGEWRVYRHPASPLSRGSKTPAFRRFRPGLLVAMMNGVGGQTFLEYGAVATLPGNRLAHPAWVLTKQRAFDGVHFTPATSTTLRYRDAAYDAQDAEFRGFGLVWREDASGRATATEFHQDDVRAGLVERVSVLGKPSCATVDPVTPNGACSPWSLPLEVRENVWPEAPPVLLTAHVATPFHRGTAIPELGRRIEYDYDAFGNVATERVSSPSASTVVTTTEYAYSVSDTPTGIPSRYIVDRPLRTRSTDSTVPRSVLAEKSYTYDATPPRTGAVAVAETCIDWVDQRCSRWQTFAYRHDTVGNLTSIRGPSGGVTQLRYDPLGLYATTTRNALGAVTTTTRELTTGKQVRTTLPDGRILETHYDGIGRPLRHYRSGGTTNEAEIVSSYFEGTPGRAVSWVRTVAVGGSPVVLFHDGLGRPIAKKAWVDTGDGVRAVVSGYRIYDPSGALNAESVTFLASSSTLTTLDDDESDVPAWTRYVRDAQGRLIETRLPDGSRTQQDSSVPGVHVTVDPNLASGMFPGAARIEFLDGFGRVWRRDSCSVIPSPTSANMCPLPSLLARSEYEYDGLDRMVKAVHGLSSDAQSVIRTSYDGLGNRVRHSSSNLGTWAYTYNDAGYLSAAVDPRGARVSNHYDKLGRLRRQIAADARSSYRYYRRGIGSGLVRRVSSKTAEARANKTFSYDQRGRITQEEWRIHAGGDSQEYTISYGYDEADRRTTVTYPSAAEGTHDTLRTEYTPYGLPFSLTLEAAMDTTELVRAVSYDIHGNPTRIDYGNDLSDRYQYADGEAAPRLRCVRTAHYLAPGDACATGASDLRGRWISARDRAGNPTSVIDFLHAGTGLDRGISYTYDALGRLAGSSPATGASERFAYDGLGNLVVDTNNGPFSYAASTPNVASSAGDVTLTHDAAGNRTGKGAWAYEYDSLGRLTEVSHAGTPLTRNHFDEGRTRIARENLANGSTTYYFGGLFETGSDRTVRYFHLAGRLVAVDSIPTPRRQKLRASHCIFVFLVVALPLLAVSASRRATAGLVAVALFSTSTVPPAYARSHALYFVHSDEVGSPELLTDNQGAAVEHRHYRSYGRIRTVYGAGGTPVTDRLIDIGFNGHKDEPDAGLVYFGSRFYDPTLGLFLTPDPQAQYASPYLYGGGNPIYAADPDGEALFGFLVAILEPLLTSAIVSSFVSAIAAASSGGDVAGTMVDGFVAGGAGAAIGTALGVANIGYQLAAGGAQYVELGEAMAASIEVARRSAFTTSIAHTASTTTRALGAGSDWATVASLGTALAGSYAYDGYIARDSGAASSSGASQRAVTREGIRTVNTRVGHANVTQEASVGTGWGHQASTLVRSNVAQDGSGSFLNRLRTLMNNQEHFGRLPSSLPNITSAVDGAIDSGASDLLGLRLDVAGGPLDVYTRAVGAATHYVQDHLTLGHMVPGTSIFSGPAGAPIRFVIHQVFGGEIAFRDAQIRATRALLTRYGPAL
jgi:RHS repeat-associated protein